MKRSTLKLFLSVAAVIGVVGSAYADLIYTFDTGPSVPSTANSPLAGGGFVGGQYSWFPGGVRQVTTTGGWTLGTTGPEFEFDWPVQTTMQTIANSGLGHVSFDLFVDDESFVNWGNPDSTWYQLVYAGNSDVGGWTQGAAVNGNYIPGAPLNDGNCQSWHFDLTFAQLGWLPGTTWFQLFFGSNSEYDNPVQFCIDPLCVYIIPEPSTFALAGFGAAALLILHRH
jgi:hypothetical protein